MSKKNTDTLSQELNALMGSKFIGIVKYDSTKPQWKDEIKKSRTGFVMIKILIVDDNKSRIEKLKSSLTELITKKHDKD
uniref:Uncharacterized protein n=1 Tax=Escherichia coli TaxID=562 RepID=A0A6N0IHW7_ECOLX|nr:hypothetical protein HPE44_07125 [Escherichia coli]